MCMSSFCTREKEKASDFSIPRNLCMCMYVSVCVCVAYSLRVTVVGSHCWKNSQLHQLLVEPSGQIKSCHLSRLQIP